MHSNTRLTSVSPSTACRLYQGCDELAGVYARLFDVDRTAARRSQRLDDPRGLNTRVAAPLMYCRNTLDRAAGVAGLTLGSGVTSARSDGPRARICSAICLYTRRW